eukprot:SAG11_NODE_862_length_6840_cov_35.328586_8_plen_133_part_00
MRAGDVLRFGDRGGPIDACSDALDKSIDLREDVSALSDSVDAVEYISCFAISEAEGMLDVSKACAFTLAAVAAAESSVSSRADAVRASPRAVADGTDTGLSPLVSIMLPPLSRSRISLVAAERSSSDMEEMP